MRTVPVIVDTHLRVDANLLGDNIVDEILDELIIPNPAREEAKQRRVYGWQEIPKHLFCAQLVSDELIMGRGFALQLKLLLREHGLKVQWLDRTVWIRGEPFGKDEFSYRPQQPAAVKAITRHRQGIYKAPTGSGKTVTVIGFIWERMPARSIILVDRINLVDQWIDRIEEHAGIPRDTIGRIGEGSWTEDRLTVATVQTLHRRRHELIEADWFAQWPVMVLDESHHATAQTYLELIQLFAARYRFGVSATPDKTGVFELALNTLGEVFYETTHDELRRLGILTKPEVVVVPTPFSHVYWRDHKADKKGRCDKPDCKNRKPYHGHRNNYNDVKAALITDPERNRLILDKVADSYQAGQPQLIVTSQTKHIEALLEEWRAGHGQFVPEEHVHVLIGKMTAKKKKQLVDEVENVDAPHIIFSTIAGEALDIGKLRVVHVPFPTRNPRSTEQNVGRLRNGGTVYDYVDNNISILAGQFRTRRWECYEPLGFDVNVPDDEQQPRRKKGLMSLGG